MPGSTSIKGVGVGVGVGVGAALADVDCALETGVDVIVGDVFAAGWDAVEQAASSNVAATVASSGFLMVGAVRSS